MIFALGLGNTDPLTRSADRPDSLLTGRPFCGEQLQTLCYLHWSRSRAKHLFEIAGHALKSWTQEHFADGSRIEAVPPPGATFPGRPRRTRFGRRVDYYREPITAI